MNTTTDFDYDTFLDGLGNVDTFSNGTTSPTTVATPEHDFDNVVGHTPPMFTVSDDLVINLDDPDIFQLNMPGNDLDRDFDNFLTDKSNTMMCGDSSTFEDLFADIHPFVPQNVEASQQLSPPPQFPQILPKPSEIPSIKQCIKLQSNTNTGFTNTKCIKLEPLNPNRNVLIATPITLTNAVLQPVQNVAAPVTAKRRRSDSPVHSEASPEPPTITLEQLKLKYGNMSDEQLKKHLRMIKNRESASLSRKRRKDLMENLDVRVKQLTDENDQLKKENSKLLTQVHTLQIENELLKKYRPNNTFTQARKPLILMGIVLLVGFNVFTLKSLAPMRSEPSGFIDSYSNPGAIVPSRTILSERSISNERLGSTNTEHDYGPDGKFSSDSSVLPTYPYIQCVAYINKTHSKRINQDLHSWVQDHREKDEDTQPMIIPDPKSLTIPSNEFVPSKIDSPVEHLHHVSRKVARQNRIQMENKGQIQAYQTYETNNYHDFIHTIDRKNDTLYFISFKRDHLILPATIQNQTQRPKMSLILPASMANLNKSIHVPPNHVPMIKIDCEVEDTKLVFVQRTHIPSSYQNDLFQYYSSTS